MSSLLTTLSGCIIPQEFRDIPAEANLPPAIQESLTEPPFSPILGGGLIQFLVVVDDPNLDDALEARMYRLGQGETPNESNRIPVFNDKPTVETQNPTRRRFALPQEPFDICRNSGAGVYAVVINDTAKATDQGNWTVSCP